MQTSARGRIGGERPKPRRVLRHGNRVVDQAVNVPRLDGGVLQRGLDVQQGRAESGAALLIRLEVDRVVDEVGVVEAPAARAELVHAALGVGARRLGAGGFLAPAEHVVLADERPGAAFNVPSCSRNAASRRARGVRVQPFAQW